jgi:hypothetical protein
MIIAVLVDGIVYLITFVSYERFFAKKSFTLFHLLKDLTVIRAVSCLHFYSSASRRSFLGFQMLQ